MSKIVTNIVPNTKISDLIVAYPNTITVLERLNIPFGFGDKKIKDVAADHRINTQAFLSILQIFSEKHIGENILKKEAIRDLLIFLRASHLYFKEKQIPELKNLIQLFSETISPKYGMTLVSFFDEYIKEVNEHFFYEDETVFPYIESVLNQSSFQSFAIREFEKNHSDIEQKLLDLKHILIKYVPEDIISSHRIQILKLLKILEDDLLYHSMVEDFLLVPSIKQIEKERKGKKQRDYNADVEANNNC